MQETEATDDEYTANNGVNCFFFFNFLLRRQSFVHLKSGRSERVSCNISLGS